MGAIQSEMRDRMYRRDVVIPTFSWIKSSRPKSPKVKMTRDSGGVRASWTARGSRRAFWFVVYVKDRDGWSYSVVPAGETSAAYTADRKVEKVYVTAVDRLGNESR